MTNGHGIETPANKIATALATLDLAIRLQAEVEAGRITAEIFKRSVTVHTDGDGLELPPFLEGTDQNLKDEIFNIVLNALSASALTVDETLGEVFGEASTDTDLTRIAIRVMVNQLRNAFAHTTWRPSGGFTRRIGKATRLSLATGQNLRLTRPTFMATVLGGLGF